MSFEALLANFELPKGQVSGTEKLLLLSLARRSSEDYTCWPSLARMSHDTCLDRKTIISIRQNLVDKGLITLTGEMKGRSGQIPVMRLNYVHGWEVQRNSPRLKDDDEEPVDNPVHRKLTSSGNGTGTSTKSGTGTSTENGTLNIKGNIKEEKNKKLFINESKNQKQAPVYKKSEQSTSVSFQRKRGSIEKSTMSEEFMAFDDRKKSSKNLANEALNEIRKRIRRVSGP